MKHISYQVLALCVAAASLSSCSRSNYVFAPNAPAYLGAERASRATAVPAAADATLTTSAAEVLPDAAPAAPAVEAGKVLAHRAHVAQPVAVAAAARPSASVAAPAVAQPSFTKAERKEAKQALRQAIKQQKAASPKGTAAEGKSQLVAALLCFFLGGLGVHDFYLGYIGKGILQIFLSIILIGFILVIIDLIRILTGDIKPKGGDYAKKI